MAEAIEVATDERLWRTEDVAERLAIGRSKVYELMRAGEIRSVRIGGSRRVSESAVREFLARL